MGHGASTRTNVKRVSIRNDLVIATEPNSDPAKTPRSSSDGCIVETLNSSKAKADLLELQLEEYKELLRLTQCKYEESKDKAKLVEEQLAEVEGKNFELIDQVAELEQQLEALQTNESALQGDGQEEEVSSLEEQLQIKDQYIEKLEVQVNTLEAELKKIRSRFKKRLKAAQTETAEARQEAALKVYSLKDDIKRLEEENTKLIARLDRASSASRSRQGSAGIPKASSPPDDDENNQLDEWEDGRTKLIVELSSQVSAQEERILDLEKQLSEKKVALSELQASSGRTNHLSSGQTRKSSAKSGRSCHQKSRWGYPAEVDSTTDKVDSDQQWLPDDDDDAVCDKPRKSSSREGSRKSSAASQRKLKDKMADSELEVSTSGRTTQRLSSRNSSGNKSSRNSSAVSYDSVISQGNGDVRSRTSSSAGSSRQRRRLQAALDNSSRYSPHGTDSAFSDMSVLSRTKDGKDSGMDLENHLLEINASHESTSQMW